MSDVRAITPDELVSRLKEDNLLLVQVTAEDQYRQAHIPGAKLVTPQDLVCGIPPATGKLPELAQLEALFTRIGYRPDCSVVVYDDEGGGWAGRFGWTLDVIGHRHWDYLDGGMHAWAASGRQFEAGAPSIDQLEPVALTIDQTPIAEIPDVLATLEDPTQIVWDVRSKDEYMGLRQASARLGHIPGAVNYDWLLLKDAQQCLNTDAHADLSALGLDADKQIITHCQTHHRSGLSYMWGRLQGWQIRAYHGSWSEWGNRDDTPIDNPAAENS